MKIQLETISNPVHQSFSLMYNPNLSDLYYWHFHPEYELVYISGATGTRHVGNHISTYEGSDLVLIGSGIPHLNFDYGVKSSYRKVVVHLQKDFIEKHLLETPELAPLTSLFTQSSYGLAFSGSIKSQVGERLFDFQQLTSFQQYLALLDIFQLLAQSTETTLLHQHLYANQYREREQSRIRAIYAYVDQHYHEKIELQEIAALSNLTKEAFCRYFKQATTYTFIEFLNRYRISQSKRYLMAGESVSQACFNSGFESLSYYNRIFKRITQENPRDFRKRYVEQNVGKLIIQNETNTHPLL